jgi:aspartyl-tRNA(Asn)/glutamyl-tRNA(Gln) amidotransferase subunit A
VDAVALARAIGEGEVSAREVIASTLERIDAAAALKSFIYVAPRDDLERQAREIDEQRATGKLLGPLAGVPIGIKDVEDVAGMPTTYGSRLSKADAASRDSPQVARLRRAGAIVVGKTSTPEFGYSFDTKNLLVGQTLNPRDRSLAVGGSSGGSAAAVSGGLVPLATGTDGGGSIRIPAAFCGLPALKPTFGRVPLAGDSWGGLTHGGALTASLRDQARYLDVVSGPSKVDRLSLPKASNPFEDAFAETLRLGDVRALASLDLHGAEVSHEVAEAFDGALGQLERAGLRVERASSILIDVKAAFNDLAAFAEGVASQRWTDSERTLASRGYLRWCERGAQVTAAEIVAADAVRQNLFEVVEDLLAQHAIILSPTVGILPWRVGETPQRDPLEFLLTYPFNLTGHPALTIPVPGSLCGVQVVGGRFEEALLLRFGASALETLENGRDREIAADASVSVPS